MKKLEGEPSGNAESVAIGAISLKTRPANEEQFVRLALARDWSEFLAHESDGRPADNLPALKLNATKAIKFDPGFAFGFYVLGRIATLEGLDGHGVRFFRRALGIDPGLVEAQHHLRLLTGSSPELPVADEPPTVPNLTVEDVQTLPNASPVATAAKAITAALELPRAPPVPPLRIPAVPMPIAAAAPPIPAAHIPSVTPPTTSAAPQAPLKAVAAQGTQPVLVPGQGYGAVDERPAPQSGRGARLISWVLVIGGVAGIGAVLWERGCSGVAPVTASATATATAPAPAPAPASVPASASASAPATATATASAPVPAPDGPPSAAPAPAVLPPLNPGPNEGVVKTPKWNTGHRLFVDGVVVGQTPAQVLVACGTHIVKVGSAGREQSIDVPCGATVTVEP